jgi:ankyrin repeat protein
MWLGKAESSDGLFNDLYNEVKSAAPGAQLSYSLRCRLERCDFKVRSEICSRPRDGSTPLFIACKRGNVEIVDYLLTACGVDVEHKGLYEVPDDRWR